MCAYLKISISAWRVPNDCKELAIMVAKFHCKLHVVEEMRHSTLLAFLIELDAIRQPERLKEFLKACEADSRGRTGYENRALPETEKLLIALEAALSVDAGKVASEYSAPERIKQAVFNARLTAIHLRLSYV